MTELLTSRTNSILVEFRREPTRPPSPLQWLAAELAFFGPYAPLGTHTREAVAHATLVLGRLERLAKPIASLPLNPDCVAGKHAACRGDAWDVQLDEGCPCACECHIKAIPVQEPRTPLPAGDGPEPGSVPSVRAGRADRA